uniref:Uncharacterized protein n=1 Tax=Alexandrium catenella TaxID=2925 RepID=A0A7S1RUI9_ALECA|mmetsp:Transcript_73337/g.194862  ORF Transcript_73337/g.194862 Transcript_73337/m.194862 type:complete len:209 (+) Transcript_73337:538-1164(+)
MREVSSACSKLGAKMETIAAGLGKNTKSIATDKLAMKVVQISVQQASEVMIGGMSEVFDSMSELLAELPTPFLKTSTREMAFYVKHHTSNALAKFNRNALQPFIKKAFEEEGDICEHVSVKVADFGKMSRSIKDNAVEAAAKLTQEAPAFGLHLLEIDIKLVPHVVSTTNKWLEDFGSSIAAMGKGFKAYHEAIAEAGKAKLRCTLKK